MTRTVRSARPGTPFHELAQTLTSLHISAVPVVDMEGIVVGVVSEGDLMLKEVPNLHPHRFESSVSKIERIKAEGTIAADLMTSPAVTVRGDATLPEAAKLMHDRRVKRLPVVDADGRLVGIVTRGDLLAVFMRDDEEIRKEIVDDVVVRTLWMDPSSFQVKVRGGIVALTGTVDRRSDIGILGGLIRGVDGVVRVDSELGFAYDDVRGMVVGPWRSIV